MQAKVISKVFKFVATLGIVLCAILKWKGTLPDATMEEICMCWITVYGIGAGTIDLNIIIDKFTGGKQDGSAGTNINTVHGD